jgi:hypothetical protein
LSEKLGQIAHLDKDPSNAAEDNLAFMCLTHHALYDSKTSQHKKLHDSGGKSGTGEAVRSNPGEPTRGGSYAPSIPIRSENCVTFSRGKTRPLSSPK